MPGNRELTYQLVRGYGWLSKTIGYWGRGYYSHIDVITPAGYLRGARSDVIQGIPAGYEDRPQNYEKWERQTRYTILVTDDQYERYWDFSDRQLHKPYDTWGLLHSFVLDRDWRDDSAWWCSEEVAANLEAAGVIQIAPEINAVTPGDCAFIFAGLNAVRQEMV